MIRTKIIRSYTYAVYELFNPSKSPTLPNVMELDRFIAEIGYDNIRSILANTERYGTRYTILYEDGLDALPPHKLCPRCGAQLEPFDTSCKYCRLQNIY